jgi:hypothetical protein
MVERIYGRGPYSITVTNPNVSAVNLEYSQVREIDVDVDDARVFGGIHFRFDQTLGADMGRRIAEYVYGHKLRPRSACSCGEDEGNSGGERSAAHLGMK